LPAADTIPYNSPMPANSTILKGTVHGKTIELAESTGLPDGASVSVIVQPARSTTNGLRRAFGGWADIPDAEFDQFLEDIRRDRHHERSSPDE
jgi:hypothetical protein